MDTLRRPSAANPARGRALRAATAFGMAGALLPLVSEFRIARSQQRRTERWHKVPVEPRGSALLGISFRPRQAEDFGLDPRESLRTLLAYPFEVLRLGAYWNRIEPGPARFDPGELDWQLDAAERAGKQIIVCLGPVKTFGYPEYFVPDHQLAEPLPEGSLIEPSTHPALLSAGIAYARRLVERYKDRPAIVAWQVEHEAVDPLGVEHSWRLSAEFVAEEVAAIRAADPARPIMMNGFLPTSTPVRVMQWWRSRDQGDSLAVAQRLTDTVGIDFYPRHAVAGNGRWSLYLDGSSHPWQRRRWAEVLRWAAAPGRRVLIAEGQAEPWEAVTTPPDPLGGVMYSCPPEQLIGTYNRCMRGFRHARTDPWAYLFWGAEYWLLRERHGDPSYLRAFARILNSAIT
jgi:glycosyl hydrolase family 42 (putative beta-galactosidase)